MRGTVTHIHVAPRSGAPVEAVDQAVAVAGQGLEGDRNYGRTRQVTLVCTGELAEAASILGIDGIPPGTTRRNITVELDELPRGTGTGVRVGDVQLAVWRDCAPCSAMEDLFGPTARQALRRRAGISAQVLKGGVIRVGDPVEVMPDSR